MVHHAHERLGELGCAMGAAVTRLANASMGGDEVVVESTDVSVIVCVTVESKA